MKIEMMKVVMCLLLYLFSTKCHGIVVEGEFEVTDEYPGGFTARIRFPVTQNYRHGWLLNLTFDRNVSDFNVFEGEEIGAHPNKRYFIVQHQEHNRLLHRDASGRREFYCQGKCKGTPTAEVRFIPLLSDYESIWEALARAEKSGITGEYPSTVGPGTTTISFLDGWTPPIFEPITLSTNPVTTIRVTTTPTTPPLNLAALNLRYNLRDLITKSLLFFEAQRSGALPDSNRIAWRSHSALSDGLDRRLDLSGGYYIDGGFVKYNYPMAFSTTILAWGLLEFRNAYLASHQIPHVMNALKWSTDYFLKCHVSPFVFYAQVSNTNIDNAFWGRPEDFKGHRPSYQIDRRNPGSDLAAEVAAALASTAMVFRKTNSSYSRLLITHAQQLYNFAVRYQGNYSDSIRVASKYRSWNGYHDDLSWAALWLYKATTTPSYLVDAEQRLEANPDRSRILSFNWYDKRAGALLLLSQIKREPQYYDKVRRFCDSLQPGRQTGYTPRGLVYIDEVGATGLAAGSAVVCLIAANLGLNYDVYRQFAHRQLSYILGDGGRSYVVGFGEDYPTRLNHRASSCPDPPIPCSWQNKLTDDPNPQMLTGALVAGPNKWDDFSDSRDNYIGNSVGLYNNAALQTLAAGILTLQVTGQTFSEPNPEELNAAVSQTFSVHHDYGEVLRLSLYFFEAQRAGHLPNDNRVPWRKSAFVNDSTYDGIDLSGGYFDGGDYVKFNFPMAFTTTVLSWGLIQFKEAYDHVGETNNCMKAIRWATDYFIKCHVSKFVLYGQVGSARIDHGYWLTPNEMEQVRRPAYNVTASRPGSDLVAETAAAMAAASIVFREPDPEYADVLLRHAKDLFEFADLHRDKYHRSITDAARFYRSITGYFDELAWAALWLYSASGQILYLNYAQLHYKSEKMSQATPLSFYWDDKIPGVQLLLAQITREEKYLESLEQFCNRFLPENYPRYTPRGLVYVEQWGPLRHAVGIAFICLGAANLNVRPTEFRNFAKRQLHYILGDSGIGSFVVGYGPSPPNRPRHRTSSCPTPPQRCGFEYLRSKNRNPHVLSGALIGGPYINDQFTDDRNNFVQNRVALDYNAAFQSAIAALKYLELYPPATSTASNQSEATTISEFSNDVTTDAWLAELDDWFNNDQPVEATLAFYNTSATSLETTAIRHPVGEIIKDQRLSQETTVISTSTEIATSQPQSTEVTATLPELNSTTLPQTTQFTTLTTAQSTNSGVTTTSATTSSSRQSTNSSEASLLYLENTTTTTFPNLTTETILYETMSNETILNETMSNETILYETMSNETILNETMSNETILNDTMAAMTTTIIATTRKPVVIKLTLPNQKNELSDEIIYMYECRPMDVFDLCVVPKLLYKKQRNENKRHCRYQAFQDCSDRQGVACGERIWGLFPFWNAQAADSVYFTDEEINCINPSRAAIEKCDPSGMTKIFSNCYHRSLLKNYTKEFANKPENCRWLAFRNCVNKLLSHCSDTWSIWKFWNENKNGFYFNEDQRFCRNAGVRRSSTILFTLLSVFLGFIFYIFLE